MSSKSKKHRRTPMMSITKATTAAEVMFVWAWMDCFHPEPEDVQKMKASLSPTVSGRATLQLPLSIKQRCFIAG